MTSLKIMASMLLLACLPALAVSLTCQVGTTTTITGLVSNVTGSLIAMECPTGEDSCFRVDVSGTFIGSTITVTLGQCQSTAACAFSNCAAVTSLLPGILENSVCSLGCCNTNNCNSVVLTTGAGGGTGSTASNKMLIPLLMLVAMMAV